jgi:hypothetical protein
MRLYVFQIFFFSFSHIYTYIIRHFLTISPLPPLTMLGECFQPKTVVWYNGNNIVLGGRGGEKDVSIIFARDCRLIYT